METSPKGAAREVVGRSPLFQGLPESQLDGLMRIAAEKRYDRGQVLFFEGHEAAGFYLVVSGRVKVYKTSFEGKEQILHLLGPGEPIAEVPVFQGGRFPASAMAVEPSVLLFFEKRALIRVMQEDQTLCMNMLATLSRRLREFTRQIEHLTLKETPARLAAYLLHASELKDGADSFELDFAKGLLANFLGTTRETLSRILTKLVEADCILSDGKRITLLDREQLSRLAEGEVKLR
jgi:CRP/FNR family transcriptional regulator